MISSNSALAPPDQDQDVAEAARAARAAVLVDHRLAARDHRARSRRRCARRASCWRSRAARRPPAPRRRARPPASPASSGHSSTQPGRPVALWRIGWRPMPRRPGGRPGGARGIGEHRIDERQHLRRGTPAVRSWTSSKRRRPPRPARRRACGLAPPAAPARRPGRNRSTASRRRRRTPCALAGPAARPRRRTRSVRARRMSHCSGAVSWASSSRMWSMPPSSL